MSDNQFAVTRIYSDANGESHFEELHIELHDSGKIGRMSEMIAANGIIFRDVEPTYDWDFHNTPRKQYLLLLDGEIEIETSDGDKRVFKGGDVLLLEDTVGKGHQTRNLQSIRRRSAFIPVP